MTTHLCRPPPKLLPRYRPERRKVFNKPIIFIHHLHVILLREPPPVIKPFWWIPVVPSLVFPDGRRERATLPRKEVPKVILRVGHKFGYRVFCDGLPCCSAT